MTRTKKILLTLLVVGCAGVVAALGVFAAFSSTTANQGNTVAAGTVALGDNDGGSNALYALSNAKPGSTTTKCIVVTYSGSLDASVKLYTTDTIGSLGQYVDLTITPGSFPGAPPANMDCTGFDDDASGAIFNNTLQNFASTHNSWANGLADTPDGATAWDNSAPNNSVVYQVTATVKSTAPNSAQNTNTGSHAITWEAQNQ